MCVMVVVVVTAAAAAVVVEVVVGAVMVTAVVVVAAAVVAVVLTAVAAVRVKWWDMYIGHSWTRACVYTDDPAPPMFWISPTRAPGTWFWPASPVSWRNVSAAW